MWRGLGEFDGLAIRWRPADGSFQRLTKRMGLYFNPLIRFANLSQANPKAEAKGAANPVVGEFGAAG
jgi:hypothetical protein